MTNNIDFLMVATTQLRYHRWATGKVLEMVNTLTAEQLHQDLKTSHRNISDTLGHMYRADAVWLARLQQDVQRSLLSAITVPETLPVLKQAWRLILENLVNWVLAEPDWAIDACYSNSSGEEFRTPAWQVILQLLNHGAYHRGQIVGMIRQLGGIPQNTDAITYYRLGCPDS